MTLPIFPTSPLPVNVNREFDWGVSVVEYDSGAEQAQTAWQKPLYRWEIGWSNMPRTQQQSLSAFIRDVARGRLRPFFLMDPYDYQVQSAGIGFTTGVASFLVRDTNSYTVIPASGQYQIWSALSGQLTQGVHFTYNSSAGIYTYTMTPSASDSWSVRSCNYFRRCKFAQDYRDVGARVWGNFNVGVKIVEIV